MRIISGKFKGRSIAFVKSKITRPLKDSIKENIFNIISHSSLLDINLNNVRKDGSFGIHRVLIEPMYISTKLLGFSNQKLSEVKETITAIYGKTTLLTEDYPAIMDLLKHDKKNVNGQVNFVLLNDFENHQTPLPSNIDLLTFNIVREVEGY